MDSKLAVKQVERILARLAQTVANEIEAERGLDLDEILEASGNEIRTFNDRVRRKLGDQGVILSVVGMAAAFCRRILTEPGLLEALDASLIVNPSSVNPECANVSSPRASE